MTLVPIEPAGGELVGVEPVDPWDRWLGVYRSEQTKAAYRRDVEQWAAFCATRGIDPLRAVPGDVNAWVEDGRRRRLAESTLARKVSALSSFYDWARDEQLTTARPIPKRRPKADTSAPELGLEVARVLSVLEAASTGPYRSARTRALVALLVFTGLRISEALALDVGSFREQRGHRTVEVVGKGDKRRTVPIVPQAWRELEAYFETRPAFDRLADAPLFTTATGRRWSRRDAGLTVRRLGARCGIDLHPHLFRHTAITLMLDAGEPLDRVQAAVGHADPKTTMRYAQARDQLDKSPVYGLARLLTERA